jgi:hypothetical protein
MFWKEQGVLNVIPFPCISKFSKRRMAFGNDSFVTEFILVGLTDQSGLKLPRFFLFLVIHMAIALGNLSLITLD